MVSLRADAMEIGEEGARMSLSSRLAIVGLLALPAAGIATAPAEAHGWRQHHRHYHYRHRHQRVRVHFYAPRYHWTSVGGIGWGCGLRQFITYYGSLAYREVCY